MNVRPASVHLRAKAEFSLSWGIVSGEVVVRGSWEETDETITWMYTLAALTLGDLDDPVPVQVRCRVAQVDGKGRAERMLGASIRIGIDGRRPDTILGCCPSDAPDETDKYMAAFALCVGDIQGDFTAIGNKHSRERLRGLYRASSSRVVVSASIDGDCAAQNASEHWTLPKSDESRHWKLIFHASRTIDQEHL